MDSYCLDVWVGYYETDRDNLVTFLMEGVAAQYSALRAKRLMWQGVKILRIVTPRAVELRDAIIHRAHYGDDYSYEVLESPVAAERAPDRLPDFDSALGYLEFDLVPHQAAQAG